MDDSAILYNEVIESYDEDVEAKSYDETKAISTIFNESVATCKTQNFNIVLVFSFINYHSIIYSC